MRIKRWLSSVVATAALSLAGVASLRAAAGTSVVAQDASGGTYQTIQGGVASSALTVNVLDNQGLNGTAPATLTLNFFAYRYDPNNGTSSTLSPADIQFSTNGFITTFTQLMISSGAPASLPFKVRTSTTGYVNLSVQASGFVSGTQYAWYSFNVLPVGAQFSNPGLRTDSQPATAPSQTSVVITPNRDGADDAAVISADPPDPTLSWEILISTLPFTDPAAGVVPNLVRHIYNYGSYPAYWYGDNEFQNWHTVDNGIYYVRLQMAGGTVVNDALSIQVQSSFIKGQAVLQGALTPLADVDVNCWGPGGGGSAKTGADGRFFIGGLTPGQLYTVQFQGAGLAGLQLQGQPSDADLGPVQIEQAAMVRVHATMANGAPVTDMWGGLNANDSNYQSPGWGTLHFSAGSSESDNGFYFLDPAFSTWTVLSLLPNTTYTVNAGLSELGSISTTTFTGAGGSVKDLLLTFFRKATAYGLITLPQPANSPYAGGGESIGVNAVLNGDTFPSSYGQAFILNGETTGTFSLSGLAPGDYTLTTLSQGYLPRTRSLTVPDANDIGDPVNGGVDFPVLSEGGKSTGTVTVTGDTTGLTGGYPCAAGQFNLYINAWSLVTYKGSASQVCLDGNTTQTTQTYTLKGLEDGTYQLYTYLPGFELTPAGQMFVTVSSGAASKDISLLQLSGALQLTVNVPAGDDPTQVAYNVSGGGQDYVNIPPGNFAGDSTALIKGLGTGLYTVRLTNNNPGRGLQKTGGAAVTNGSTSTLSMDLTDVTYSMSGTVTLQGSLQLPPPFNVTVSSAAGLQTAAASQGGAAQVFVRSFGSGVYTQKLAPLIPLPSGDASFAVTGLPNGAYQVSVCPDMFATSSCSGSGAFASSLEPVFIQDAGAGGVDLVVSNGIKVSGTLSRPSGDASTDSRNFYMYLSEDHGSTYFYAPLDLSGVSSVSYSFSHVPPGTYSLSVSENSMPSNKYAAAPLHLTVAGSDMTGQNVTLQIAGQIVGKFRDLDTNTLITSQNKGRFLSQNFRVNANANPYVPGAYGFADNACDPSCGIAISTAAGQFSISGLLPGAVYDVEISPGGYAGSSQALGQKTYAPVVVSGVQVAAAAQVVDLGTIDLKQGVEVSGKVTDAAGTPLPNIPIEARSSVSENGSHQGFSTLTDAQGAYVLGGLDRDERYYDIIAARRFEGGNIFGGIPGPKYAEETLRMVDVQDAAKRQNEDFRLVQANGVLTGRVITEDGGPLSQPFGEGGLRDRQAMLFLHRDGAPMDNPLGETEESTDQKGYFSVNSLKPAVYTMRVMSGGYVMARKNVVVSAGTNDAGTITLKKGATCAGTILKPDGSNPNGTEVQGLIAVDDSFEEFVSGTLTKSGDAITGYSLDGFKAGPAYSLISFSQGDDLLSLKTGLTFSPGEAKTVNLVYKPSPPSVFATQSRAVDVYTVRFFSTHKLRNLTADDKDLSKIVTITQGAGTVLSRSLSSSRDTITLVYQAAANETSFTVKLSFASVLKDLESPTGANFTFTGNYAFFAGVLRSRVVRIPNATGGTCGMEGETSSALFPGGTFDVAGSSQVQVGVQNVASASDLGNLSAAPKFGAAYAQSVAGLAQRLGAAAYPSPELYKAVSAAPAVSPFSSFYDFFLPAGVNHTLKKDALITLQYGAGVTDPSTLNVYYFDPGNGVFLLENAKRVVDATNRTITVAVRHLSTFVVLSNNAPVITGDAFAGTAVTVQNFPNPFNLTTKNVTFAHPDPLGATGQTIEGTMIRVGVPAGKSGTMKVEIFDVAGSLVREISKSVSGGAYAYTEWDGRNDGGKKVASGVYLARFTLNDGDEKFFKMAVIK